MPLYRHLAQGVPGVSAEPKLGYIVMPSEVSKTDALIANWTEEELEGADEAAREVVRRVRKRIFGPPAELPAHYTDEFADICRSTRFLALEEDEEDADEHDG